MVNHHLNQCRAIFHAQAPCGNLQTLCKIQHNYDEYMHTFSTKIYFKWNKELKIFIISTISIKLNTIIWFRSLHYCRKMEKQLKVCSFLSFLLPRYKKLWLKYTGTNNWKSTGILGLCIFLMPSTVKCFTTSNTGCSIIWCFSDRV
jgi:hypothetical protein